MIIANPIYDVVFKFLMEELDVAKGIISTILGEEVVSLQFSHQERILKESESITLCRLDFAAKIKQADGSSKNVLIEIQKAKLTEDISRFRNYLANEYMKSDEVHEEGVTYKKSLPIYTIYFLGFVLDANLPETIKVKRHYYNGFTNERLDAKNDFVECLTHDSFIIQIPKLSGSMSTPLERMLSVFNQNLALYADKHVIRYNDESISDDLLKRILRQLKKLQVDEKLQARMQTEDEVYNEVMSAVHEMQIKLNKEKRHVLEERQRADRQEAKAEREKAKAEREKAKAERERSKADHIAEAAVQALMSRGMSVEEARKILGL